MEEREVLDVILNNLKEEVIESVATYFVLADYTLEEAEDVVKYELPDGLQAPKDYKIRIYDNKTGEIAERTRSLDQGLRDTLLLIECRRYMDKRKKFFDDDTLKEFEEICKDMDKRNIKKI